MFEIIKISYPVEMVSVHGFAFAKPKNLDAKWAAVDRDEELWMFTEKPTWADEIGQWVGVNNSRSERIAIVVYNGDPAESLVEVKQYV